MPLIRDICDRHGILLIADEVITAFGRTGGWTGSRLFGVQPDLMCTAKAITNGYFPFGAVMINEKTAEAFRIQLGRLRCHRARLHLFGTSGRCSRRARLPAGNHPYERGGKRRGTRR